MKAEDSKQSRNFKKLSNVEHVRMRTGMWLGQNSLSTFEQHFFKAEDDNYIITHEEIQDIPAKLKCLDEACMNAVDEYRKNLNDKGRLIKMCYLCILIFNHVGSLNKQIRIQI